MDGHSSCTPRTVGPRVQFSGACEQSHWWPARHIQQEAICYQWFKQRLIPSVSKPSISQRLQIKEDTVELSVPSREFNLKGYAAITWHNDRASLCLEPRLADHCSQAARTKTLPTAPPMQATPTPSFKVTPFFDAEYLRNCTTVLIATYTRPTQQFYFVWA